VFDLVFELFCSQKITLLLLQGRLELDHLLVTLFKQTCEFLVFFNQCLLIKCYHFKISFYLPVSFFDVSGPKFCVSNFLLKHQNLGLVRLWLLSLSDLFAALRFTFELLA
jgi:hypothetical protein